MSQPAICTVVGKAGVAATERDRKIGMKTAENWCFSIGEESEGAEGGCFSMEANEQLLDGIVSSMRGSEKDDGKGVKNAEQWCFSIGEESGGAE
jgi:hypothetical protein